MSKQNENKKRGPVRTPDASIEEGLDDINSANGKSQNVISNTHKRIEDEKHGRKHGEPLTGTTPRAGD